MAFGSRLGISNHLIRRVTRHRSVATLFHATPPAAGPAMPLAPRALDPKVVVTAIPVPFPDSTSTGEPFPSPVPPDQELGAATFGPESERVATGHGLVDTVSRSAPARPFPPPSGPLPSGPLPSGMPLPVAHPAQAMPGGSDQAPTAPRTADASSAPFPPTPSVGPPDTSSTITDDVWRRLRTIFDRHQTAVSSPGESPPAALSQQAVASVPPSPLPDEALPVEAVPEPTGGPPPERSTETVLPQAAPTGQPSRAVAPDANSPTVQSDAGDLPATAGHSAAGPTPTAEMDLTGQSRAPMPLLAPDLESSPQPLEQVWDVERIGMRPPEAHEPSEDTWSQTALSDRPSTRTVPSEADTVIQAHRPATPPVEAPPTKVPPSEVPPSEAPPKVTAIDGQIAEDQDTRSGSESVRQLLGRVAAGGPTQSTIEVLPPRRPRPPAQRPTEPRASTATPSTAPEPSMVQTAIGPLPSDLWDLIDEPVPDVPQPAPHLGDRGRLADRAPLPTVDSDGPSLPGPHPPSRHVEHTGKETRSTPGPADTTPASQRRAGEPTRGMFSEPRETTRAHPAEAHNGAAAAAGAPVIQRTLAPAAGTAMPVTTPSSQIAGPSAPPGDTDAQAAEGEEAPGIDVAELARRVYAEVKRRLSVERERSPWH